ncbi:hypothetical protein LCGC14_0452330 [marine sediment metagenome]|uniref:Uncharacterized protein n=1 Tax=marine sediment metagenome TaxID=412755 RepID=A0A0F9T0T6_9ZZZZ
MNKEIIFKAAKKRIDALQGLLLCYRVEKNPSIRLSKNLDTSRKCWDKVLKEFEEVSDE